MLSEVTYSLKKWQLGALIFRRIFKDLNSEGILGEKWFSPENAHLAEFDKMPALSAKFLQMRVTLELISEQVGSAGRKHDVLFAR